MKELSTIVLLSVAAFALAPALNTCEPQVSFESGTDPSDPCSGYPLHYVTALAAEEGGNELNDNGVSYVAGVFFGSIETETGNRQDMGEGDAFLACFVQGEPQAKWVKTIGGPHHEAAAGLRFNEEGSLELSIWQNGDLPLPDGTLLQHQVDQTNVAKLTFTRNGVFEHAVQDNAGISNVNIRVSETGSTLISSDGSGMKGVISGKRVIGYGGTHIHAQQKATGRAAASKPEQAVFTAYPNPSNGIFNVLVQLPQHTAPTGQDKLRLSLVDVGGKQVYTQMLAQDGQLQQHTVNAGALAKGVYMVVLEGTNPEKRLTKCMVIE